MKGIFFYLFIVNQDKKEWKHYGLIVCISFACLCCRAARFKGYQQQDSHELLRYLLDSMKNEQIKVTTTIPSMLKCTSIVREFVTLTCFKYQHLLQQLVLSLSLFCIGTLKKHFRRCSPIIYFYRVLNESEDCIATCALIWVISISFNEMAGYRSGFSWCIWNL